MVDFLDRDAGALHFRLGKLRVDTGERLDHAYLHRHFPAGMDRKGRDGLKRGPTQAGVHYGPACKRLAASPLRSLHD